MKGDFRVKMKKEILKDYLTDNLDIEKIFDDFYGYVYTIVKNDVNKYITNEDIEEIISDVFIALWKNKENLPDTTNLKAYLAKTAKNIIKNTYRKTKLHYSLSDFENKIYPSKGGAQCHNFPFGCVFSLPSWQPPHAVQSLSLRV